MKNILLTIVLAGGMLALPCVSMAQDEKPEGKGRRSSPEERVAQMKEKLSLTDEQAAKVKSVFEASHGKMRELRDDQALSAEDRRSKMGEIRKAQMEEVRGILTPEQQEKMKEMRKEAREKNKQ